MSDMQGDEWLEDDSLSESEIRGHLASWEPVLAVASPVKGRAGIELSAVVFPTSIDVTGNTAQLGDQSFAEHPGVAVSR